MDSTLLLVMFAIANAAFVVQTIRLRIAQFDCRSLLKQLDSLNSDLKSERWVGDILSRVVVIQHERTMRLRDEIASHIESVKYWKSQVGKAG